MSAAEIALADAVRLARRAIARHPGLLPVERDGLLALSDRALLRLARDSATIMTNDPREPPASLGQIMAFQAVFGTNPNP